MDTQYIISSSSSWGASLKRISLESSIIFVCYTEGLDIVGTSPEHLDPGTEKEVLVSLESEVRWYETVDTTVVVVPVVTATSSGPI